MDWLHWHRPEHCYCSCRGITHTGRAGGGEDTTKTTKSDRKHHIKVMWSTHLSWDEQAAIVALNLHHDFIYMVCWCPWGAYLWIYNAQRELAVRLDTCFVTTDTICRVESFCLLLSVQPKNPQRWSHLGEENKQTRLQFIRQWIYIACRCPR